MNRRQPASRTAAVALAVALGGHAVALRRYESPIFGRTWRPECVDCGYHGPFVPKRRAAEIGDEHRRKSAGAWWAAR